MTADGKSLADAVISGLTITGKVPGQAGISTPRHRVFDQGIVMGKYHPDFIIITAAVINGRKQNDTFDSSIMLQSFQSRSRQCQSAQSGDIGNREQ